MNSLRSMRSHPSMARYRTHTDLSKHFGRRAIELGQWDIPDILQIVRPLRGGIEAAGGEVSVACEEHGCRLKFRFGLFDITDVVADRTLLKFVESGKFLVKPPGRFRVYPDQPFEDDRTILLLARVGCSHPLIQKLDHADA